MPIVEPRLPSAESRLPTAGPATERRGPPRVLVVDDDAIDRMLARAKLHVLGCDVVAVGTGEAALDELAVEVFDVAFMDCRMPVPDGFETTRRLRLCEERGEVAHRGRLPVIAATGGPEYRECCEAAGMSDFLVKPYSREDIKGILRRWLGWPSPGVSRAAAESRLDGGPGPVVPPA